jgi:hypothetical protein
MVSPMHHDGLKLQMVNKKYGVRQCDLYRYAIMPCKYLILEANFSILLPVTASIGDGYWARSFRY